MVPIEWVDKFAEEAKAAVAANPLGESDLEADRLRSDERTVRQIPQEISKRTT